MTRIGLLGCGNIGNIIARHKVGVDIVALFDTIPHKAEALAGMPAAAKVHRDFNEFIRDDFDIVVEAASVGAVESYAEAILEHGKDLIVLSVGALADTTFRQKLEQLAGTKGRTVRIPSGALFGLDNLKIGQVSHLNKLILRTTKPPASLGMDVDEKRLLFQGSAKDCIRRYPKNINVAVALSLAAGKEAEVELWVDPAETRNTHEVIVEGDFGNAVLSVQNVPSPDNPATSYLAALSILTLLKDLERPLKIGT